MIALIITCLVGIRIGVILGSIKSVRRIRLVPVVGSITPLAGIPSRVGVVGIV